MAETVCVNKNTKEHTSQTNRKVHVSVFILGRVGVRYKQRFWIYFKSNKYINYKKCIVVVHTGANSLAEYTTTTIIHTGSNQEQASRVVTKLMADTASLHNI